MNHAPPTDTPPTDPIISRPGWAFWFLAAALGLAGVAGLFRMTARASAPGGVGESWEAMAFGIFFFSALLAAGGYLALYAGQNVVVADADGLRWRAWRRWTPNQAWQSCPWEDVTDFYVEAGAKGDSFGGGIRVETRDGHLLTVGAEWTQTTRLGEYLVERAVHADDARRLDGRRALLPRAIRPASLPITFEYRADALHKLRRGTLLSGLGAVAFFGTILGALAVVASSRGRVDGPTPWLVFGGLFLLVAFLLGWQVYGVLREVSRALVHAAEGRKLVASRDGLTCWQDGESVFLPWGAIIGWEFAFEATHKGASNPPPTGVRIRAENGREVILNSLAGNFHLLRLLLREYATEGVEYNLTRNEAEALGGVARRWSGGEEGKGARVFHVWTRANLKILGSLALFPTLFGFLALQSWFRFRSLDGLEPLLWFTALLCALPLFQVYWMAVARVEVDRDGLTRVGPRGRRTFLWDEIARYNVEGGIFLETRDGRRIEFPPALYAYGSELPALITENVARFRRAAER
jgi:hypothetical protein